MAATRHFLCLLLVTLFSLVNSLPPPDANCAIKTNLTRLDGKLDLTDLGKTILELENCLYYYLLDKDHKKTGEYSSLLTKAPSKDASTPIKVEIENVIIHHVELKAGSSYRFHIQGDIYLNWPDPRLEWDATEWGMDTFTLQDGHHIWSPKLVDKTLCGDSSSGCETTLHEVDLNSDGHVYARIHFAYDSLCEVDYTRYPEEENECCIFFSTFESGAIISLIVSAKEKSKVIKEVGVGDGAVSTRRRSEELYSMQGDHSAWVVLGLDVSSEIALVSTKTQTVTMTKIAGFSTLQLLRVCIHAEKTMSTLKMALRIPVTIATLLMLVSPLFGDLRAQVWVKLFTLSLQTISFLFLCSIAPPNGFGSTKPSIYTFYETVFILTLLSVLVTVCAMALCRVKRTVPPSHKVFLLAKLINKLICCVEPEPGAAYQRHFDENESTAPQHTPATTPIDYTIDWRHLYIAANNLCSGLFFTFFVFFALFEFF